MAANAPFTVRGEGFGRTGLRLVAAATLVLIVLGATIGPVGAWESSGPITISKEEWIKICTSTGGTATDLGDAVICNNPDGSWSYCSWYVMWCTDHFPDLYPGMEAPITHGTVGGGTATTGDTTSTGTGTTTVRSQVAKPGTTLVLDNDEQP